LLARIIRFPYSRHNEYAPEAGSGEIAGFRRLAPDYTLTGQMRDGSVPCKSPVDSNSKRAKGVSLETVENRVRKEWRAQEGDLRIFLDDFASGLPHMEFAAGLSF
jgi:hypothetical protein